MNLIPADLERNDNAVTQLELLDLGASLMDDADTFMTAHIARFHACLGVTAIPV